MKDKKTYWLTAFRYVVPADYEKWFEELAADGWHPVRVGQWSSIAMRFRKGEPKKYRYVVDMQPAPKKEYKTTYKDFGWEFVGQMASAYVWRREYAGERPESFSDIDSRRGRNRRFIWAVAVSFAAFLICGTGLAGGFIFSGLGDSEKLQMGIFAAICFAAAAALSLVMRKIAKNIDR